MPIEDRANGSIVMDVYQDAGKRYSVQSSKISQVCHVDLHRAILNRQVRSPFTGVEQRDRLKNLMAALQRDENSALA